MSKGKLIAIEGLDGSGKATQAKLLAGYLAGSAAGVPAGLGALAGFGLGVLLMLWYNRHVARRGQVQFTITAFAP